MKKRFLIALLSLFVSGSVYADISGYQVTQRPILSPGYNIVFYDNFSLSNLWGTMTGHSGQYIVNPLGSTTSKGMRISHCTGEKTMSIKASIVSGTQTIQIKGSVATPPNTSAANIPWENVLTITNVGSSTVSMTFPINEHYDFIQIRENITEIGTDNLTVRGSFLGTVERLDRDFTDGF